MGWELAYNNDNLWHFRFHGPTPEALVKGREKTYFAYFWNDLAADKKRSLSMADRKAYVASYSRPGRMRAGWAYFAAWPDTANDFAGDVITPGPTGIEYPTLLNFPAPVLRAYPRETVVAEKLEALTALGLLNSRMKDFYDLALLFRLYPFEGQRFWEPVSATFRHRGTAIEPEPIGLTQAYSDDPARAIQWRAFVRRSRFGEEAGDLARLIGEIRSFALPVLSAVATGNPFGLRWKPGGSWE
jgi:Nucleotidyl transferase AbiEii toxin, Type IV TA system